MNGIDFLETYTSTLTYLNSPQFITKLKKITGIKKIYPDVGLHGGDCIFMGKVINPCTS